MTPTPKHPAIENLLTAMTGVDRVSTILGDRCTRCNGAAGPFRDELSRREYQISGLCQKCQDVIFNSSEE
jgi:hypothetical protein